MWKRYNPNPTQTARIGDCSVRAIAKALETDWEEAYILLSLNGYIMGDMPNSNTVINSVLKQNGFKRMDISNECPDCYTIKEFCKSFSEGRYVVGTGTHVVAIVNGDFYDSWDSGDEIVAYAWKKE